VIQRGIKIQLLVFGLLAILGITYTGFEYIGFDALFDKPFHVTLYLKDSGGLFDGAQVTERGISVGKVGTMSLTAEGVKADLVLDHGTKIPADLDALVANQSFVGEQYVDLSPRTASGPMLAQGGIIPVSRTSLPIADSTALLHLDQLANSVDKKNLQTVVDGLGKVFADGGHDLQRLIDSGDDLATTATVNLPDQVDLIQTGQKVLATARDTGGELRSFSTSLRQLTDTLRTSDPDFVNVLTNGTKSAQQVTALLKENKSTLTPLLSDLITFGQVQAVRLPGLEQLLVIYPEDVRNTFFVGPGDGTSHFGLVNDQTVGVCQKGYETTHQRSGQDLGDVPANNNAFCNEPLNSTLDIRGSREAPRPPGDCTDPALAPGGAAAQSGCTTLPSTSKSGTATSSASGQAGASSGTLASEHAQMVSCDPLTSLITMPDGSLLQVSRLNGNADLLAPQHAWSQIFLGALSTS